MNNFIEEYDLYIFDLDDTLYSEEQYLFQAYRAIGQHISTITNVDPKKITQFLEYEFLNNGRDKIFDRLNAHFQLSVPVETCLKILRNVKIESQLALFPAMENLLREILNRKKPVYLATNGNKEQQINKVSSIQWNGLLESIEVVYCSDIEPKPSPAAIKFIVKQEKVKPNKVVFVGDSDGDQQAAENAGVTFIHVSKFLSC